MAGAERSAGLAFADFYGAGIRDRQRPRAFTVNFVSRASVEPEILRS
jgi:hypothetical protein